MSAAAFHLLSSGTVTLRRYKRDLRFPPVAHIPETRSSWASAGGVTEPAAVAAGPGTGAERLSHQRGQRCAVGWLHAAPAATKGCHFYLARKVSFLNCGNNISAFIADI